MKFLVDIPETDKPADTDPNKSNELWLSALSQGIPWSHTITIVKD